MKSCVVIGGGVVGATTALALTRKGFDVELIEAADAPAQGASKANAGLISPGHCFSWAEPGVIPMMIRSGLGLDGGVGVCQRFSPSLWAWGLRFMRESTRSRWDGNSRTMLALAAYSRDLALADELVPASEYGRGDHGILYLQPPGMSQHVGEAKILADAGEPHEIWDEKRILSEAPDLAALKFGSGVFCPQDLTGNVALYAAGAVDRAVAMGARVSYGEAVRGFDIRNGQIQALQTSHRRVSADQIVVCAGLDAARLLALLGYRLPIYPLSGYSITYTVPGGVAPRMGIVSVADKIAWSVYGPQTVRFTGFADVGIPSDRMRAKRLDALEAFVRKVAPELTRLKPERWVGHRPMTPGGVPIVGQSAHKNLWFNVGHGSMGWTMAHGSAALISDAMSGTRTALDLKSFAWQH